MGFDRRYFSAQVALPSCFPEVQGAIIANPLTDHLKNGSETLVITSVTAVHEDGIGKLVEADEAGVHGLVPEAAGVQFVLNQGAVLVILGLLQLLVVHDEGLLLLVQGVGTD